MNNMLGVLGMALVMSESNYQPNIPSKKKVNTFKEKVIPKGTKKFYFNDMGEISHVETDFIIIAINEKNAKEKFQKKYKL